ncbi:hypothetical protein CHH28_16150 [Bacterioplanes sanyensis]|uniref:HTH lysR-type domain-containing protein n=1 Tax=Bacterioplanes sanyensis TaxID=1249553 RepID=A0A222FMV4_9GAMM|nr:LysR substrate-binding domain-containing protein [Bacterioplanes sanyensis]ASP40110.1 hypothetical protein CHH28_16150 [Bacterioplanes sanyensis]
MHKTSNTTLSSLSLDTLQVFASAARSLSFRSAAEQHKVTPTAVSHRMRQLESQLGRSLFERQPRQLRLSSDGQALLAAIDQPLHALQQALQSVFQQTQALTIACTPAFASHWLIPRLADWQQQYPQWDIRIHSQLHLSEPQQGTVDMAIRCSEHNHDGHWLCADRFVAVAAPTLLAQSQPIPALRYDWHNNRLPMPQWTQWQQRSELGNRIDDQLGGHFSDESHAIQAAIAGQGALLVSELLIQQQLQLGLLQPICQQSLPAADWWLVGRAQRSAAERCFQQWLQQQLSQQ